VSFFAFVFVTFCVLVYFFLCLLVWRLDLDDVGEASGECGDRIDGAGAATETRLEGGGAEQVRLVNCSLDR
jgi:hypothetical protein